MNVEVFIGLLFVIVLAYAIGFFLAKKALKKIFKAINDKEWGNIFIPLIFAWIAFAFIVIGSFLLIGLALLVIDIPKLEWNGVVFVTGLASVLIMLAIILHEGAKFFATPKKHSE